MSQPQKTLVAVAWPYVNGDLHVGHLAGYLLPADIFARFQRLYGNDVLMVSGSDCHGTPITVEADKLKLTPQQVVDKYHPNDIALFKQYNFSYNLYTKTTTSNHKKVTQQMFLDLLQNDYIVIDIMKQYYSSADNAFLPDRYVEGICPHCNAKDQRSDQCENCGRWLEDGALLEPHSKLTGASVELKDTQHYFLDFEKLQDQLKKYVYSKQDVWRKWVWAEANGWLQEGLRKRAITRDMDWAIELPIEEIKKLPKEKQLNDFAGKHIYVWFEAVIGYLSAPQEWMNLENETTEIIFNKLTGQSRDWHDWWNNQDAKHYYFMGQDNLVFHTLMWPAQLMGAKKDYVLPHNVAVNKFMNYQGKKFSKSRNWTIDSKKIADKYGVDLVRYYVATNLPENKEGNFTWEGFVDSINNELVANFGNLVNRTLKFVEMKFAGKITKTDYVMDEIIKSPINQTLEDIKSTVKRVELVSTLEKVLALSRVGNKYFDEQKVWEIIKTDENKAKEILLNLLNLLQVLSILINPFLPASSDKLRSMLGLEKIQYTVGTDYLTLTSKSEFVISDVILLFEKLDKETVLAEKEN